MGEVHLEDAIRIQRERVARRTAAVERQLYATSGLGGIAQTPHVRKDQIAMHGTTLVAHLRLIVETWARCGGSVPQPLSAAVMDAKRAILAATAEEVSDA